MRLSLPYYTVYTFQKKHNFIKSKILCKSSIDKRVQNVIKPTLNNFGAVNLFSKYHIVDNFEGSPGVNKKKVETN